MGRNQRGLAEQDLYTIGEVAAIIGVSTHTIRAWERRHGIVQPVRTRARQRRYRAEDVQTLRDVKRAVDQNGLSLRLAFQSVTGSRVIEARPRRGGTQRPEPLAAAGTTDVWRRVADVLPQLILLIDANGRIVEANIAAARTLGVVVQQLRGRMFADLVDPFDRAKAVLLYRPRPRTVTGWELNLMTEAGTRLYTFQSWSVRRHGDVFLALVASELFAAPETEAGHGALGAGFGSGPALLIDPGRDLTAADAFQGLVDQLPFGVAVASVGAEPRVVYANLRLAQTLGIGPRIFTGRPIGDLLRGDGVRRAIRAAAVTGKTQTLKRVPRLARARTPKLERYFNLEFQPLLSSARKVASVMVVVEDSGSEGAFRHELEELVADHRFEDAETAEELGQVALEHLVPLLPGVAFAIALCSPPDAGDHVTVVYSPAAQTAFAAAPAMADSFRRIVTRTAGAREGAKRPTYALGQSRTLNAIPFSTRQRLGALAWSQGARTPITADQRMAVDAFVARLAVATELLHLRAASANKAARFNAVVKTAAVMRDSEGPTGLGTKFLKILAKTVGADAAAIGRIDGPDFVVEAAYAHGGTHASPGDRFPLSGRFVSASLRSGEATKTTRLTSPGLPERVRRALVPMKQGLSVPLVFMGRVTHVLTLMRTVDRPFAEDDVRVVQALSGIALLAVGFARERFRGGPRRATGNRKMDSLVPAVSFWLAPLFDHVPSWLPSWFDVSLVLSCGLVAYVFLFLGNLPHLHLTIAVLGQICGDALEALTSASHTPICAPS